MANWTLTRSTLMHSFWIATPCVPGGVPRVMLTDDFGNLVDATPQVNISCR